ncbi:MAG: hypothetical protein Q7T71_18250, partial [Herbiconiux sp.]|nr:hypothetical protein [Herbiconiux sp.]
MPVPVVMPARLRAFLGLGGVASFHRLEWLVDSLSDEEAIGQAGPADPAAALRRLSEAAPRD